MLFWHVGATIALIRYAFRDPAMDLRFLAIGAITSDLIDLPIGIALWSSLQAPRLAAHSLLIPALAMVGVLLFTARGGAYRKPWMLFAVGMLIHLLLDGMWRSPETLWWPFLGTEFTPTGFETFGAYAIDVVSNPLTWAGEAIGIMYLVMLWRKSGLSTSEARSALWRTGVVSARIDRIG